VVISDSNSSQNEYDTSIETIITDNLVGGGRNDWATDGIPSNLELSEGNPSIKVISKDNENVKEITNVIIGDDFRDT
jgi:hypothetical protein